MNVPFHKAQKIKVSVLETFTNTDSLMRMRHHLKKASRVS